MPNFADRASVPEPSGTLAIIDKVQELRRRGVDVFSFSNRPPAPAEAIRAAQAAVAEAWSSFYTDTAGWPKLRQGISRKFSQALKHEIDPKSEVLVTVGAKEAIFLFVMATVGSGDEVVMPDPAWVSYEPMVRLAGGQIKRVPMDYSAKGFELDPEALKRALTPRTKAVILCTPHNPTGLVLSADVLKQIADIANDADLFVLVDECYQHYLYDDAVHHSLAAQPDMFKRTITVATASKIFNMFGWRVGWAIGPEDIVSRMLAIHQHVTACATSFAQAGAAAALEVDSAVIDATVRRYDAARRLLIRELNEVEGISCHLPAGAYFAFPNIRGLRKNSVAVSHLLLEHGGVQTVPGSSFGPNGEGFLRINFTCTEEDAARGAERIRKALRAAQLSVTR